MWASSVSTETERLVRLLRSEKVLSPQWGSRASPPSPHPGFRTGRRPVNAFLNPQHPQLPGWLLGEGIF